MVVPGTTPPRFATDITNVASHASSSSRRPKLATRTSYRQTSLADSFFRSSSPLNAPASASTPATSVLDATRSSSPCARDVDGDLEMDLAEHGEDYDEAEHVGTRTTKRRRMLSSSSLEEDDSSVWNDTASFASRVHEYDTACKRIESTFCKPGQQLSALRVLQRRELGFSSNGAQREHLSGLVSEFAR